LTTHYTNLKHFASLTEGIINGAMAFDNHLMQPLFLLQIGKPGSSFAFEIARKIGLPEDILNNASEKAGVKNINYDRHLKDIARDKRYWENKRQNIRQQEKQLEELIENYEKELSEARSVRKEIISKAKDEAKSMLENSNKIIENTVRQIKEVQAEKEKTKEIRQQLDEYKSSFSIENPAVQTNSEKKVNELKIKIKKLKQTQPPEEKKPEKISDKPLKPGDTVRMKDTLAAGEVIEVREGLVQVETGNLRIFVPVGKLERISKAELKKSIRAPQTDNHYTDEINLKKIMFKPEIDIRGVRGEEAINQVRDLIDNALIVQYKNLRILHGKGNGILRQLVREYLATVDVVKTFRDEHIEFGGSGITIVEMDF
jgi:DNA mismatch repair protein MutS2